MRVRRPGREEADVPLSPLIDCVFLLLIFFLVTSMIKRWEHQVPLELPDQTSSLSDEPAERAVVIAVDEGGGYHRQGGRIDFGRRRFRPVEDLAGYLNQVAAERGTGVPLEIAADRDTPFQVLLDAVDVCRLQGFETVSVRITTLLE